MNKKYVKGGNVELTGNEKGNFIAAFANNSITCYIATKNIMKRSVLFISISIGLGHAPRYLAIAQEQRIKKFY